MSIGRCTESDTKANFRKDDNILPSNLQFTLILTKLYYFSGYHPSAL